MHLKLARALTPKLKRTCWLTLPLAFAILCALPQTRAVEIPTITSINKLWRVPGEFTDLPNPVKFEFTVNYYDPYWHVMWGENDGLPFFVNSGNDTLPAKSGQRILVEGEMVPSQGINLAKTKITVLPPIPPPSPLNTKGRITDHKTLQCHIVTIEGYVEHQAEVDANHLLFETASDGRKITVRLHLDNTEPIPQLKDSLVRFTGVYVAAFDAIGEISGIAMWIPSRENIQVVGSIKNDPRFDRLPVPIENLLTAPDSEMVTVTGTVVSQEPGRSITLRDQTGQIIIQSPQSQPIAIGQTLTAIGYPGMNGTTTILRSAYFRTNAPDTKTTPAANTPLQLRRLVGQVQQLSPENAALNQPVRLSGMVTWANPTTHFIYLQDATGGIRVHFPNKEKDFVPPTLYSYIQIEGTTLRGDFTTEITATTYTPKGRVDLPTAQLITLDQAMTGVEEGNWVELQAYVNALTAKQPWTELAVTTSSGELTVRLPPDNDLQPFVGAIVRVKGICSAITNQAGQLTSIRLWSPEVNCLQIETPATPTPFTLPESTFESLRRFHQLTQSTQLVHLTGQVIDQNPGHFIRIQNNLDVITAMTTETKHYTLGDRIDLVGVASHSSRHLVLRNAISQLIGPAKPPQPLDLNELTALDETLYGRVVRLEGRLLEMSGGSGGDSLLFVQSGDRVFDVLWEHDHETADKMPIGTQLQITGIYLVQYDLQPPTELILRVRAKEDLVILALPPWWTIQRALAAIGLLAASILIFLLWVTALRRRVKRQTGQIRVQLEKETFLQTRHLNIVENASDFIYTLDLAGHFTSYNPAGERLTGYPAHEALGTHILEHIAHEDAEQLVPLFKLDPTQDATANFQARFKHKDGRLIWTETSARVMSEKGEPTGLLAVTRDIGQRKELEDQLRTARDTAEANTRAKSAFLANMSHEIRTPMNGVIGMSNLLLQTPLNDEQRDFSETIRHSAESLLVILNDILDFSKIEAGKLQFDHADFDLRQMIADTLELMTPRASAKGLSLTSSIPQAITHHLRGDAGRIRQVILNLLGNAIKFTKKGDIALNVSLEKETTSDLQLRIEITDTGLGISREIQATLFQPFAQADTSTTRKFGGTGLGLVISKQIVELMHGQIGVESTPHRGSTFWFTLKIEKQPLALPHEKPTKPTAPAVEPLKTANALPLRILIAEDNLVNQRVSHRILKNLGYNADIAVNGLETLAAIQRQPYDIIFMDGQMPELDGYETTRRLRADPTTAKLHIIAMTANAMHGDRQRCLEAGMDDYISKPAHPKDIADALARAATALKAK